MISIISNSFIVFDQINAPQILSPGEGDQFNLGTVTITWDRPQLYSGDPYDPYSVISGSDTATYEIEYTDNYNGEKTKWYTLKRRIPWADTSYAWIVGKMIKSSSVRIRMRLKDVLTEEISSWSISNSFSVNVFKLIPPAIISPVPGNLYNNFMLIILDESETKNTYNQKVRYTLEYSSDSQDISWTKIVTNIPPGQNIIRWDLSNVPTADDYVLRLIAKNSSTCLEPDTENPDQIAQRYVYQIKIQQSGIFVIDTKPPQGVLEIENNSRVTNQTHQVVNIFAEDDTTEIKSIQIRECNISGKLQLGDITTTNQFLDCPEIDYSVPFDKIISDVSINNLSKIQWIFNGLDENNNPISSVKKLEALLTDAGGNNSLQDQSKVFLTILDNENDTINDFLITIEQREVLLISGSTKSSKVATYEVAYLGTSLGKLIILEPFPRTIYTITDNPIVKLSEFNDLILIFTYNSLTDIGKAYRHDVIESTLLYTFTHNLSKATGTAVFKSKLYIGLENGEIWEYNGSTFTLINTFDSAISCLFADQMYLYIGFSNSTTVTIYNGTSFAELDL